MQSIAETHYQFPGQVSFYKGKVRDVYTLENDVLVMIASDRISAFDVVLPEAIPGKGQVLNGIAAHFLKATADLVPNWLEAVPHPQVSIGKKAQPFKVEMVVRAHLTGHAWRTYVSGERILCGVSLPEGMEQHQAFESPIITPTTKADLGAHDEDISREDILAKGIVSESDYLKLEEYSLKLFARGREMAKERGLILVDTKYEFGKTASGEIILIDEIHTPDSSRYFLAEDFKNGKSQVGSPRQLSKEFVREWLIANGFQGKEGQKVPFMSKEFVSSVSKRYAELYEKIVGTNFESYTPVKDLHDDIAESVKNYLSKRK